MLDLEFEAVMSLLSEMCDKKKATAEYLSRLDGRFSFLNTSGKYQKETLGKIAVNDNSEHPLVRLLDCR